MNAPTPPTVFQDRWYQEDALTALYQYFVTHGKDPDRNPAVAMPTGTGKAVVIAKWIQRVMKAWPSQRILVMTHVKELLEQNASKLLQIWPQAPIGFYSAGVGEKISYMPITFGGIQTVRNSVEELGKQDLVIIDECHLCSPDDEASYKVVLKALREKNPKIRIIGLSATCYRLGLGMITDGGIFTDICYDITDLESFNRLIDEGYLSPLIPKATGVELSIDGVKKRGGEFVEKDLQKAVVKYDLTYSALEEALELAHGRNHVMVYATGIDHVEMIVDILGRLGETAVGVHSKSKHRDDDIARFKAGQVRWLVNANILTTGFDFPALDCIVLLRPTNSPVLHVQILGRGTRPFYAPGYNLDTIEGRLMAIEASDKQTCLVLDFAGNVSRLGPINDPRIPKRKGEGTGEVPVKRCDHCDTLNHISARFCINPDCEEPFPINEKITPKASTLALIARDEPRVVTFDVDRITYQSYQLNGIYPTLHVSYYCGPQRYSEHICLEHLHSNIIHKARAWWRERLDDQYPLTIRDALPLVEKLREPKQIRVWVNKGGKFNRPQIMSYVFGGDDE